MQLDAWRSLSAMEDKISALLQENHEAQIPILYVKTRRKMNGIWLKDISSRFPRDYHSAESWWLFPGCGKCGGGFLLTEFLSVSTPCSMKSPMKPGNSAPHGVPALQPPKGSKTSVREYCLADCAGHACRSGCLSLPLKA